MPREGKKRELLCSCNKCRREVFSGCALYALNCLERETNRAILGVDEQAKIEERVRQSVANNCDARVVGLGEEMLVKFEARKRRRIADNKGVKQVLNCIKHLDTLKFQTNA